MEQLKLKWLSQKISISEQYLYLGKLFFFCVLVGIVAGAGAIVFFYALDLCKFLFLGKLVGYVSGHPHGEPPVFKVTEAQFRPWLLLLVPTLGGLISGWLVFTFAPEAEGHGTDAAIEAYHHKGGNIRPQVPLIKAVASAITIGSGGSGGREGPIAQIAAGFGSMLGKWFHLTRRERSVLLIAGMGAGIGAIFRAPVAGALFASEVLYRNMEFEHEVLVPTIISSVVAYSIFAIPFGWDPLFATPRFAFANPLELISYGILAVCMSACAWIYVKFFYTVRDFFRTLALPAVLKPAIGGFLAGLIALLFSPETLATSYGLLQELLNTAQFDRSWIGFLFLFGLLKIVSTSFSIGSGGSGGVFAPSLVIGGALGGALAIFLQEFTPLYVSDPRAFILVGMAGFFSAAANAPISTLIMVSELTGNYTLLPPTLWVCIIAFVVGRRFSLYENQIANHFATPVHTGEFMEQILKNLSVREFLEVEGPRQSYHYFSPDTSFGEMLKAFSHFGQATFPVLDEEGRYLGVVEAKTLRKLIGEQGLDALVIAKDLIEYPPVVTPEDNMLSVMELLVHENTEDVMIVEEHNPQKLLGVITRSDFVDFYDREMIRLLAAQEEQA